MKPTRGKTGISQTYSIMGIASPLEDVQVVRVHRGPLAVDGHHQGQAHRHFGGSHGQDKEDEHLAVHGLEMIGETDEGQVDGVQHHLQTHEDDEDVAPDEDPDRPQGEQGHA